MKFSVIIPCYNAEKHILQSVMSAANQCLPPYEIVVIDDDSTDASIELVRSCGIDVRLLQTSGLGAAGARNAGIQVAQGDWLAFLDADDMWYANHLERAARLIKENQVAAYINHRHHLDAAADRLRKTVCKIDSLVVGWGGEQYLDLYVRYTTFVGMSACIVDKKAALQVGGLDESQIRRHDIEFWLRLIRHRKWLFDPVATSVYRCNNPGGLSSNQASAELYRLMAFLKNREVLEGSRHFVPHIRNLAYRALAASYLFGAAEDRSRAHAVAYRHLRCGDKVVFGVLRPFTSVLKALLRRRRL